MNNSTWFDQYRQLNASFQKRMVYRLGGGKVGFFSEYNNMIVMMLYCLDKKIRFELYSDWAPFTVRDGWTDYFEPFDFVNCDGIHRRFNQRYNTERIEEYNYPLQNLLKPRHISWLYRKLRGVDYLTQDLWSAIRDPAFARKTFTIPQLGWYDTSVVIAAQDIVSALWHYNIHTTQAVAAYIKAVNVPIEYISMHIRAGDKSSETKVFSHHDYIRLAEAVTRIKQAFVMTDDYTVVEQLRLDYPMWQFVTLAEPAERGYFQNDFLALNGLAKYQHHVKLFAEVELAARAKYFFGAFSSNVGMYMGMRIGPEKCRALDFDEWQLW